MADFSIFKKIKVFFETVISTPFFISYAILGVILIVLMIYDIKKHKKLSKIIYITSSICLITFFIIKYFNIILKFVDSFIELILNTLYFPNLGLYVTMLIIINVTLAIVNISKKMYRSTKICTSIITIIVDFIFILSVGIISKNKIDITSEVKLYSDSTVLTLLQISMSLFVSLYLILLLIYLYNKFKKYDVIKINNKKSTVPDMGIYFDDDINDNGDNSLNKFSKDKIKLIKIIENNNRK